MAQIVNLRAARKEKARQAARASGDQNAARHGLTKVEKKLTEAQADKARRDLDAHRIEAERKGDAE